MVRYVAVRHFFRSHTALRTAFSDATGTGIGISEIINPLVDDDGAGGPLGDADGFDQFERMVRSSARAPASVVSTVSYAKAILEARFSDAYEIWSRFPTVAECLAHLPSPPTPEGPTRSIAVVLPGPATGATGPEIDGHDLVARTGMNGPVAEQAELLGSRFDIAFLNRDRFRLIENGQAPPPAGRVITKPSHPLSDTDGEEGSGIEFTLTNPPLPTSQYTYLPVVLVPWCFREGLKPTLYNADFYLGSTIYQDAAYDPKRLLTERRSILRSYLQHDVFFTHAALRQWRSNGNISTRGRLSEILTWDGATFAAELEDKWHEVANA